MAMQNGSNSSGVLWVRAKELLRKEDYERLKIAIKTFSKTTSLEGLCSDLLKIVNSRSKVDILTEVRSCLPKNQRNTFTRHCNELLKSEAPLDERGDLEKKRKNMEAKELDRENRAENFQGSPAKKTRQNSKKPQSSRSEKKELQESNQLIVDCSKESQTLANKARKIAARLDTVKPTLGSHGEYKTVVLERKSLNQEFGFKIRGGTFHQPAITVAQVAKDLLADRQGLKTGDRIVRVNDQSCGRGGLDIAQVIGIIKTAEKIHMRIVSGGFPSIDECNVHGKRNKLVGARAEGTDQKRLSVVCVYPNEDGWLGCCIRGGTDYACDVHVISVDSCSPAERAGVKAGDVIMEINGASTKELTHVQVVRLVITSGPCVTFSLKSGSKQRRRSSRRQHVTVRPTPLRTQQGGSQYVTPPGSPAFSRFHVPGYPHEQCGTAVDSPSQLPIDVMRLDCMPPPPYTPEVPSRHRLLAKGGKGQGPQESSYRKESQGIHHQQEQQGDPNRLEAQDIPNQEEREDTTSQQELQGTHHQLDPQDPTNQGKIQDNPYMYQEELQDYLCQEVAMEVTDGRQSSSTPLHLLNPATCISDGNKANFEECMADAFQHGNILEQDYVLNPVINVIPLEEKTSSEEKEPLINETTRDTSTGLDSAVGNKYLSTTSKSPAGSNGGESFLSQIRQFNKKKLKKLATCSSEKCQSISGRSNYTSDELKWKEDGKDSIQYNGEQENVLDATDMLSVLKRVMKHRARSLHDTLSSADEGDSSNDDDDYEWEL